MQTALEEDNAEAAELVACEAVVIAETKDQLDWELLGECAETLTGTAAALKEACDEVEEQEDEHLYRTQVWCRELWRQSLGLPSASPPAERQNVKPAIAAARKEKPSDTTRPRSRGAR